MCEETLYTLLEDAATYNPDTLDLNKDPDAAEYWLNAFQTMIAKFAQQAKISQFHMDETAAQRAEDFRISYMRKVKQLQSDSFVQNKALPIRKLLELNETLLRIHGFPDPWLQQKKIENEGAIALLEERLKEIDEFESTTDRWTELVRGVLAGNMFDWGAQAVADILEKNKSFGLHDALNKIQKRPWLLDNLDSWLKRLQGESHKCAVIFVDNSGVDVVLGILPFARELLRRETKVLLCANTEPSLNDVTYKELKEILEKCCCHCDILANARNNKQLLVYANGQKGPCLDMRTLPKELCHAIQSNKTDLLVIEGMGRALHTNLHAKFRCETLKLAVIKNQWLAKHLGGEMFSVLCKYES